MWLACDIKRPGPSGGRLPAPLNNSCDLALFGDLNNPDRGVLVVSMQLQFVFHRTSADDGLLPYTWAPGEKEAFARDSIPAIKDAWDDRFRITTASTVPKRWFRDVGVIFRPTIHIGRLSLREDFEFKVFKVPPHSPVESYVDHKKRIGQLDSTGTQLRLQRTATGAQAYQVPVAHEFGHMLGLRDEYLSKRPYTSFWAWDIESMLNRGEQVRPRHYVPFAMWLTQMFAQESARAGVTTTYRVEGPDHPWDETNAQL